VQARDRRDGRFGPTQRNGVGPVALEGICVDDERGRSALFGARAPQNEDAGAYAVVAER
jgi:hypothetical protein